MSTIESDMLGGDTPAGSRTWSPPSPELTKKLSDLIKDIRFAMLTTVAADGSLRSRPMATQNPVFENGEVWFFTADDSPKTAEIAGEHEVNLAYAEPKDQRYVSLSGTASLVRDPDRAKRMWNADVKPWFPGGLDDPHLCLLRVRVHGAEFWDAPGGRMASLFARAKASMTGERPPRNFGEHQKVSLAR